MAGIKTYQIKIDGIEKSIDAVKSLEKELFNLEQRIKTLESKSVNIKTTSSGGGSSRASNVSALSEEEKLEKQILQTEAKREAYSKEIYQNYLAAKEQLDETVKDQKQLAAAERLSAKAYSNTITGMKQELADIKAVMQTVDLGDSDQFDKLTQRANELNEALKKIEESYGQFGRNVGNYKDAFNGLDKLVIKVGDTEREFNNAREASRTLKNELINLEAAGKGSTTQADNLRKALYNLSSVMDDATKSSKAMDTAMDFMQSFTAMASIGNGFKSFFGFDDNEITKSIQKLVALQGVLNGLESIRKQMETQEGIGKLLAKNSEGVDKFVTSLTGAEKRMGLFVGTSRRASIAINLFAKALKGLTSIGWMAVITVAVDLLQKLGTAVSDWVKGDADLINSTDVVNAAIDSQNKILEERLKLVQANMNANNITPEQARVETEKSYAKALEETNKRLKERAEILALQGINRNGNTEKRNSINLGGAIGDKGVTTIGGYDEAIKSIDDFIKRWDEVEKAVSNDKGLNKLFSTASDARDELSHLAKLVGGDFINAINKFSDGTQKGARQLSSYVDKMDKLTSGRYSKAMQLVKVDNEGLQKELDEAWKLVQNLRDNIFKNPIIVKIELDTKIEQELDRLDPTRPMQRQLDEWKGILERGVNEAGEKLTKEETENIEKIVKGQEKALKKAKRDRLKSERNDAKALAAETENYRKQLRELQIQNMKDGWEKEKAQLQEEWRQRLFEVRNNGVKVKQLEAEINKLYNKKIEDAEREHNAEMAAIYKESWNEIYRISDASLRMNLDSELTQLETNIDKAQEKLTKIFDSRNASYGGTRFNTNVSDKLKSQLGYWIYSKEQEATGESRIGGNFNEGIERAQQYQEVLEKAEAAQMRYDKALKTGSEAQQKYTKETLDNAEKELNAWIKKYKSEGQTVEEFKDFMEDNWATEIVRENNYTKSIFAQYTRRINETQEYYRNLEQMQKLHSEEVMKNEIALLKNEENAEKRSEVDRYENQMVDLKDSLKKGLMTREHYNELVERANEEHAKALEAIAKRAATEQERLTQEDVNRKKQIVADGLRGILNEYRDAYNAISKIQTRQPQTDKEGWGVVNIKQTRKNYKEALEAYKALSNDILDEKNKLQEKFDNDEITFDDFQQAKRELDGLAQDTADAAQDVTEKLKDVEGEFIRSIQQYIQALGQGLQTIMSAVWDAQDTEFDNEARQLDKLNEQLEKAMDKNEEILERHKNNVESIESELQTARGARREHLIDQLNAEVIAERRAAAEKKKIEKEQEALKKKQDDLDKKRQQAQYQRELTSILVSGALATINAYATKPFVPVGLAMGSLSLGIVAAQYAIAKANPPKFANGGLLEGKSHAQGGIRAGGVELEGNEYVVNKHTTMQNLDLLEYINANRRKLNISDLIDFYSGDRPRKAIQGVRNKFADGGQIPTLRTDIDVNASLREAFREYASTPTVVQVVDIVDKTKQYNNVRVLAGLEG